MNEVRHDLPVRIIQKIVRFQSLSFLYVEDRSNLLVRFIGKILHLVVEERVMISKCEVVGLGCQHEASKMMPTEDIVGLEEGFVQRNALQSELAVILQCLHEESNIQNISAD